MRNKILIGLTTAVAATAIAAPAAMAQEVIPPAQPSLPPIVMPTPTPTPGIISPAQPATPTNLQPQGAAVHIDNGRIAHSRHGYAYAVFPVVADNVPYNSSVSVIFSSKQETFKPRTNGSWSNRTGMLTLSSKGAPGVLPGQTTTVIGHVKLAFKGKSIAQLKKDEIVSIEIGKGGYISQPVAGVTQR
jgi:hypothetical protein